MNYKKRNDQEDMKEDKTYGWYIEKIKYLKESEIAKEIRVSLLDKVGRDNYFSWFEAMGINHVCGTTVSLHFVGKFRKDTVKERFGSVISEIIKDLIPGPNICWFSDKDK